MWLKKNVNQASKSFEGELVMKELVDYIVKSLVDSPELVRVNETAGSSIVILEISVGSNDIGKVIGKEGRIANAIRTIVKAAAAKSDKKITVEILTNDEH
jgi:predicted RNA-binding protein YlqC (UPF0109 family)